MSMKVKGSVPAEPRKASSEKPASKAETKVGMTKEQAAMHADGVDVEHYDPRPHSHDGGYPRPRPGGPYYPRPPRPGGPYYPRPPRPGGPYYPRPPNGPGPYGPYNPGPNGPYGPGPGPNPPGYELKNRLMNVLQNERPAGYWDRNEWQWALNALRDFPPHRFTPDLDSDLRRIWRSYNGSYQQFMTTLDNAWR